jgi:hypothetical protein
MGHILDALSTAASSVGKAVNSAGIGSSGYQPQTPQLPGIAPIVTGASGDSSQGLTSADAGTPQGFGIAMAQADPSVGQVPAEQASAASATTATDNPYTPYDDNSPKDTANIGEDITVTGDAWKPKEESLAGKIGDYFMGGLFHKRTEAANLKEAVKGFQEHPERAVSRIAQVNPRLAVEVDQKIAASRAEKALEAEREVQALQKSGNLMGSALGALQNAAPAQRGQIYSQMLPTLQGLAKAGHYPADLLPPTYDENAINTIRASSIPTYQQTRLNQLQESIRNTEGYRNKRLGQMDTSVNENIRHDKTMEDIASRKGDVSQENADKKADKSQAGGVMTKFGPMATSPDGNKGRLVAPDGSVHYYLKMGKTPEGKDNWVPIHSETKQ